MYHRITGLLSYKSNVKIKKCKEKSKKCPIKADEKKYNNRMNCKTLVGSLTEEENIAIKNTKGTIDKI